MRKCKYGKYKYFKQYSSNNTCTCSRSESSLLQSAWNLDKSLLDLWCYHYHQSWWQSQGCVSDPLHNHYDHELVWSWQHLNKRAWEEFKHSYAAIAKADHYSLQNSENHGKFDFILKSQLCNGLRTNKQT